MKNPNAMRVHRDHRGRGVKVGDFKVLAGGTMYMKPTDLDGVDSLVCLREEIPPEFESWLNLDEKHGIIHFPLPDYGGVPDNWEEFLREQIIPLLESGKKVLAFCAGSHGRTGTFLGSLIAILETPEKTPDPIAAVRQRHCMYAVETWAQAKVIFDLRRQELPSEYKKEFR